jgi:hypothetical protein
MGDAAASRIDAALGRAFAVSLAPLPTTVPGAPPGTVFLSALRDVRAALQLLRPACARARAGR